MYHFLYKTTNLVNNKIYYGVHSTENINDTYLGSGKTIGLALKKYGVENFYREIVSLFDTREEAFLKEAEIVTEEFVKQKTNYNEVPGGFAPPIWKGEEHHFFGKKRPDCSKRMKENNPVYLDHVMEMNRNTKVVVNKVTGEAKRISKSEIVFGDWQNLNSGKVTVRDMEGNCFSVSIDDPRYISGELIPASRGTKRKVKPKSDRLNLKKVQCPHCQKEGGYGPMQRWHFDKCKEFNND